MQLARVPRLATLGTIAAMHAAGVAGLLLVPAMEERLVSHAPVYVEYREIPRERPQGPPPLPRPALRDPARVMLAMPPIALAPEIPVTPAPERAPPISGPLFTPLAPDPALAVEAPRFDMAYLKNPPPAYPSLSRRMKEQGRVILRVLVSTAGTAENVEVRTSSGSERLDRAAMDAVRNWRFAPARRGAETIAAYALVPILFQLDT